MYEGVIDVDLIWRSNTSTKLIFIENIGISRRSKFYAAWNLYYGQFRNMDLLAKDVTEGYLTEVQLLKNFPLTYFGGQMA